MVKVRRPCARLQWRLSLIGSRDDGNLGCARGASVVALIRIWTGAASASDLAIDEIPADPQDGVITSFLLAL